MDSTDVKHRQCRLDQPSSSASGQYANYRPYHRFFSLAISTLQRVLRVTSRHSISEPGSGGTCGDTSEDEAPDDGGGTARIFGLAR